MNKEEKEGLILEYAGLVIRGHLLEERLTFEEQKKIEEIPTKLGMSHRDIIMEWARIISGKKIS
jgi:hypothetical protein